MLGCSKQTVLRLVDEIRLAYGVEIEEAVIERRKYYRLKKRAATPALSLSASKMTVLQMCQAFTEHLSGPRFLSAGWRFYWSASPKWKPNSQMRPEGRFGLIIS
jgi:hypothetical protein